MHSALSLKCRSVEKILTIRVIIPLLWFNQFYVIFSPSHTHTHTHTRTQVIIFLTASSDMRSKLTFPHQDEWREGKALSAAEEDKSCVGGPGVLCRNPKVTRAWLHTSSHGDTEGQGDWRGNPFTRMTTTPSVSPESIFPFHISPRALHFFFWRDSYPLRVFVNVTSDKKLQLLHTRRGDPRKLQRVKINLNTGSSSILLIPAGPWR